MAEEITLKLTVDAVGAAQSVKELKQVIKDATSEALKFEKGSAEFSKFANIAAQAKDKLQGVRDQMAALDPDAKAQSFLKLGSAIVGGFTAAQGAAALFGASTEDVQKALLKVQAAMALLQGFQAIQDGAKAFTVLKGTVMSAVAGMSALKAALIATGIGAIVVLVGSLAANWDKVKKSIDDLLPGLGGIDNFFDNLKKVAMGTLGSIIEGFKVFGEIVKDLFTGDFTELAKDAKAFGSRIRAAYTEGFIEEGERQAKAEADAEAEKNKDKLEAQRIAAEKARKLREEQFQKDMADGIQHQRDIDDAIAQVTEEDAIFKAVDDAILQKEFDDASLLAVVNAAAKENEAQAKADAKGLLMQKQINALELAEYQKKASMRMQIESGVFTALSMIGNATIKNQEKLIKFQKRVAAVQMIVSQVEALAQAVKAGAGLVYPANLIAIASGVGAVIGIFAGIAALFSKAGDVGGGPSLDTNAGISAPSAAVSANVPTGVNFLDQPNTKLGGDGSSPPPPPTPIIIENHISEYDISKTQKKVSDTQRQATID